MNTGGGGAGGGSRRKEYGVWENWSFMPSEGRWRWTGTLVIFQKGDSTLLFVIKGSRTGISGNQKSSADFSTILLLSQKKRILIKAHKSQLDLALVFREFKQFCLLEILGTSWCILYRISRIKISILTI